MKRLVNYFMLGLAVCLGTLSLLPPLGMFGLKQAIDLDFIATHPQPIYGDAYPPNNELDKIDYIHLGSYEGPESIAINKQGDIYFSLKTGEIRYIKHKDVHVGTTGTASPSHSVVVVGRPLGIFFDQDENLLIADSVKGLLRLNKNTNILEILTGQFNGTQKLTFVNDVACATDGMIYFSDSTTLAPILDKAGDWNTYIPSIFTCFSGQPAGKFLSYNPKTKITKVLIEKIAYSNGVTLDQEENSVFVCESATSRVLRYWIKGVNAGKSQVFIDNLPGYPDGIRMGDDGKLYIAIFGMRSKIMDFLSPYPMIKRLGIRLPFLFPKPHGVPMVVIADPKSGDILGSLQGSQSKLKVITNVVERDGVVYIGSLIGNVIGVKSTASSAATAAPAK
ncbi:strictosidine synthase family protein [Cavenderia fasciculata]|uniref:Strictosidine synthase family protein n=1 Tax=Cavenderia fasciculata TaxID=261658 RepID=F4QCU3_CACFS|nr:strictosidine synthase family protein [Cavenderia fasciculata]EGG14467.1 strictosidine synthase family protein [Cavenderia fasciculata]|eukprot:XP_004353876.1 strictosidine synthase family protein [Cavenderia fasciculata]